MSLYVCSKTGNMYTVKDIDALQPSYVEVPDKDALDTLNNWKALDGDFYTGRNLRAGRRRWAAKQGD